MANDRSREGGSDSIAPVRITGVPTHGRVVLGSRSPRRLELLRSAGVEPVVVPSDVDETPLVDEKPLAYVTRLATSKAMACPSDAADVVIAADTTVDLDATILGKPDGLEQAGEFLRALSGRDHEVHTAVAIRRGGRSDVRVVSTRVWIADLDATTIDWYVGTGEPLDKAGAYALQGSGGSLVARIDGSVSNVIGLPLVETIEMLRIDGSRSI